MKRSLGFALATLSIGACGGTTTTIAGGDGSVSGDAPVVSDTGSPTPDGQSMCEPLAWPNPDGGHPWWDVGGCPEAGCPSGTMCVAESLACCDFPRGCAPASCGCTVCGTLPCAEAGTGVPSGVPGPSIVCETPTQSRRDAKADIDYVTEPELDALAHQALDIRLARYRYKNEPPDARRRLGFLIDDQPDPSPAVQEDRAHVDEYGYTSMLLATVQRQEKEIRELDARIHELELRKQRHR